MVQPYICNDILNKVQNTMRNIHWNTVWNTFKKICSVQVNLLHTFDGFPALKCAYAPRVAHYRAAYIAGCEPYSHANIGRLHMPVWNTVMCLRTYITKTNQTPSSALITTYATFHVAYCYSINP